jgi:hypothetical protein
LRIFWAAQRVHSNPVHPEIRDAVRAYILETRNDFDAIIGESIKIFFCHEPEEMTYKGTRVPLDKMVEAGGTDYEEGAFSMYIANLRIGRRKIHWILFITQSDELEKKEVRSHFLRTSAIHMSPSEMEGEPGEKIVTYGSGWGSP